MGGAAAELRSTVLATGDLLLATAGLAVVCYPAVFLGNALLDTPLNSVTVRLLVGIVALGGAYPFVSGDWSYGTLWWFVLALLLSAVAFEVVVGIGLLVYAPAIADYDSAPRAIAFALAYGLAYLIVFQNGLRRAGRDG